MSRYNSKYVIRSERTINRTAHIRKWHDLKNREKENNTLNAIKCKENSKENVKQCEMVKVIKCLYRWACCVLGWPWLPHKRKHIQTIVKHDVKIISFNYWNCNVQLKWHFLGLIFNLICFIQQVIQHMVLFSHKLAGLMIEASVLFWFFPRCGFCSIFFPLHQLHLHWVCSRAHSLRLTLVNCTFCFAVYRRKRKRKNGKQAK